MFEGLVDTDGSLEEDGLSLGNFDGTVLSDGEELGPSDGLLDKEGFIVGCGEAIGTLLGILDASEIKSLSIAYL